MKHKTKEFLAIGALGFSTLLYAALFVAAWGVGIYVVVHFVIKYW